MIPVGRAGVTQSYSVFISAVTREFGGARDALANALQARGIGVKVQRSFDLGDSTTLAKLHDYIRGCNRVLSVIGSYCGMFPPDGAVTDEFRAMLPDGMTRASLTQWEVIFARHYGVETYFFEANGYLPEQQPADGDDAAAQATWRHWLFDGISGYDRRQFANADALRADVMELDWPNLARPNPSNLPGSIGHLFKGREEFLESLRESFKHNSATAITGKAVHGLGGVGKTRTAIEYGHAHAAEYAATFFLTGKSENDLRDSLAGLSGAAVLDLPEKDVPNPEIQIAAVNRWLRRHPGWLLIIDNVDEPAAAAAVVAFLHQVSLGHGHVLITSRVSEWGHMVEPLELDLLSLDAAKELLLESTQRRARRAEEEEALTRLADEQLGCLSLALVQAAAYIDEHRIGFAGYSALFEKEAAKLLAKLGASAVRNLCYPLPVALTWQTTFAQLSDVGKLLLDMLAWLSIEPIPRDLLAVWPQADTIDLEEGLAELTRYSFVHWEAENSAFTVHRLVAQVTRENMDDSARDRALDALFPWIYDVNPEMYAGDVRCWPQMLPLLPHALLLLDRTKDYGPYPRQACLYDEYATLLRWLARYSEAEPLYRRALAIEELSFGSDHPNVATRLNNLAGLLRNINALIEAESLYRRALAIDEAGYGSDHPEVATDLINLAGLLRATNRLAEAEPLYRRALTIGEASYGPNHPWMATSLNNLAGLLRVTNRPTEAEPLYRRALAINEENYGSDHPNVATTLNNLAGLLRMTHRLADAEPLYRRAIAIDEASYGPDHPEVATDLNNLAELLAVTDRIAEAEPPYRRAALIFLHSSKASGHLLPNTAVTLRSYASVLVEAGRERDEANAKIAELMIEAGFDPDELWSLVFGDQNSDTADADLPT